MWRDLEDVLAHLARDGLTRCPTDAYKRLRRAALSPRRHRIDA
jgi:hypothetical protein